MIGNPPAYRYHGGGLSVIVPDESIETALQAARQYHVDYLILDQTIRSPGRNLYPNRNPSGLALVQTFTDDPAPVYIFKVARPYCNDNIEDRRSKSKIHSFGCLQRSSWACSTWPSRPGALAFPAFPSTTPGFTKLTPQPGPQRTVSFCLWCSQRRLDGSAVVVLLSLGYLLGIPFKIWTYSLGLILLG